MTKFKVGDRVRIEEYFSGKPNEYWFGAAGTITGLRGGYYEITLDTSPPKCYYKPGSVVEWSERDLVLDEIEVPTAETYEVD